VKNFDSIQAGLQAGTLTCENLTQEYLAAIESQRGLNAFISVFNERSLAQACAVDRKLADGTAGPLAGMVVSIKDLIAVEGERVTCASKILEQFVSVYSATVASRLIAADAILIGKTNMDEFAMGSSTENSAFGRVRLPQDGARVPGGSSGGSAVAVRAGMSTTSLGSDTGGSIRQPASCCSIVGLKPTYGRVSRYGMIAFASSLDQAGPLTKDVTDCAIMLNTMGGYDPQDSTSSDAPVPDYTKTLTKDIKGLKIGIPKEYFIKGLDSEIEKAVRGAIEILKKQGATVVDVSLPHTDYAIAVYYLVATAEASSNLARFDGVKFGHRAKDGKNLMDMYCKTRDEGFGPEVKRRIMLGTYSLSAGYYEAYYKKASQVRTLIKRDFEDAFKKCDVIVTPTSPTPAFKIGEKTADPLTMYLSDIFTISCNLAGIPGLSLPCGFTKDNLPIGLQILGKPLDEETVLKTAYAYEQSTEWHKKRAKV